MQRIRGFDLKCLYVGLKRRTLIVFFLQNFVFKVIPRRTLYGCTRFPTHCRDLKPNANNRFANCLLSLILSLFLNRVFECVCLLRPSSNKIEWCDEVGQIDRRKKVEGWWTETMLKRLLFLSWTSLLKF